MFVNVVGVNPDDVANGTNLTGFYDIGESAGELTPTDVAVSFS